jgi:uncharacterized membrane protein YhaH (DUF805 family)
MFAIGGEKILYFIVFPTVVLLLGSTTVFRYSLTIRRLHDFNFSGYWIILMIANDIILMISSSIQGQQPDAAGLIAGFCLLIQLSLYVVKGTNGLNKFGDDPVEKKELVPVPIPL